MPIYTTHALERMRERGIDKHEADTTFNRPETEARGKQAVTQEYTRKFGDHTITMIARRNEKGEWIVLSCWRDPPLAWTKDYRKNQAYQQYRKAGFWGKLWYVLKKQLGII